MWTDVQRDLADILSSRSFVFLTEDPGYVRLFRNAGMPTWIPRDPAELRPDLKFQLGESARMCAQLLTRHVEGMGSLRERRAKAVVLDGPRTLYRLWTHAQCNRIGPWWFTEGVLQQAMVEAAGNRRATVEWLRDRLAISIDWNDCDRLAKLVLHSNNAMPAIEAWGLPMRQFSKEAPGKPGVSMPEYWAKCSAFFQGQKTQYFLPFVPASRVTDYW